MEYSHQTIVIGGGLAGLSCAVRLHRLGQSVTVLEATERVGGRLRSDVVDGFTLDHGFQLLLTAYPACQELLDYESLRLRKFDPGALVRVKGKFETLSDPWRRPSQAFATAMADVGSFSDKLRIAKLRRQCQKDSLEELYERENEPTSARLKKLGFSPSMINLFFRPFLGGVMLDESLMTSSRMLDFVFRMFASGDAAIPAEGMSAIPQQLAEQLPRGTIQLRKSVESLQYPSVSLSDGSTLSAPHVVVATESNTAARLLGVKTFPTTWKSTTNLYFAALTPPDARKMLMLSGDETGPVQSTVVLSNVAPEYAPAGQSLVSVSISDAHKDDDLDHLDASVRKQLRAWFGEEVCRWKRLRCFRIPFGLPSLELDPVLAPVSGSTMGVPQGIFVCGDHRETASIQGAINSGLRVAEAITAKPL